MLAGVGSTISIVIEADRPSGSVAVTVTRPSAASVSVATRVVSSVATAPEVVV